MERAKENAMTCATELFQAENAALLQRLDEANLAYITTITAGDARRRGILPADVKLADATMLYVLHDADGQVLGVSEAWATAYGAARRNDFQLLSVH
jgi:hypothetical protein